MLLTATDSNPKHHHPPHCETATGHTQQKNSPTKSKTQKHGDVPTTQLGPTLLPVSGAETKSTGRHWRVLDLSPSLVLPRTFQTETAKQSASARQKGSTQQHTHAADLSSRGGPGLDVVKTLLPPPPSVVSSSKPTAPPCSLPPMRLMRFGECSGPLGTRAYAQMGNVFLARPSA